MVETSLPAEGTNCKLSPEFLTWEKANARSNSLEVAASKKR